MKVVRRLASKDYPWLQSRPLTRLLKILNSEGGRARMVGGCVRDALLGRQIIDIDLACSLPPEESKVRLEAAGVKVIPTGLKHGTLTAVVNNHTFEITTLRQDVETDGRHAKVAFIDDWLADAERRDFTFNALYLDGDGSLYDPCDGLKDLEARRVRFIGDADQRIQEDALRILRFFRFAAQIGQGRLDPVGLAACVRNRDLIEQLSGERLAQEIFKILQAENLVPILKVMADEDILDKILPGHRGVEKFNDFVRLEMSLGRCDVLARLACLWGADVGRHLRLSNKQAKVLKQYAEQEITVRPDTSRRECRHIIYLSGREQFIFALLNSWAGTAFDGGEELLRYAENWPIPNLPVQGRNLIDAGVSAGPKLGRLMQKLDGLWLESDFTLSGEDLLEKAQNVLFDEV